MFLSIGYSIFPSRFLYFIEDSHSFPKMLKARRHAGLLPTFRQNKAFLQAKPTLKWTPKVRNVYRDGKFRVRKWNKSHTMKFETRLIQQQCSRFITEKSPIQISNEWGAGLYENLKVITKMTTKFSVFFDVIPCSLLLACMELRSRFSSSLNIYSLLMLSIIFCPKDGENKFLRKVGNHPPDYTVSHPIWC